AIYELSDSNATIDQLLQYAGGTSTTASNARISIERIQNHHDRAAMEVVFDQQGLATVLQQGDILHVLSIIPMYQKTVTLRGNTANPGRFAWHKGMRLSDLIPDRNSLLTRDYWWKRAQAGLPAPQFEPVPMLAAQSQPSRAVDLRTRAKNFPRSAAECRSLNAAYNSNWYRCGPNGAENQGAAADQNNLNSQSPQNTLNQSGGQFPGDENINPPQQDSQQPMNAAPAIGGGTLASRESQIVTENTAGATRRIRITLPAPEIDWDYAVIERLNPNTL